MWEVEFETKFNFSRPVKGETNVITWIEPVTSQMGSHSTNQLATIERKLGCGGLSTSGRSLHQYGLVLFINGISLLQMIGVEHFIVEVIFILTFSIGSRKLNCLQSQATQAEF